MKKFKNIDIKEYAPKNIIKKNKYSFFPFFICIVIGLASNKIYLFDKEQVPEGDAKSYAPEIGAIYKFTSACSRTVILILKSNQ